MIPDFQTIMLPLLKLFQDEKERTSKEVREQMVAHFSITAEEQSQRIPSGKQPLYYNRIAWAIAYLKMADLLSSPSRAVYVLTKEGGKVLKNPPEKITIAYLSKYSNFTRGQNSEKDAEFDNTQIVEKTPDELIEIGYTRIENELSSQLLRQIKSCTPYFFEKLVVDLLIKMGYGGSEMANGEVTPKGSDEGIDGIIKEDKLGLDRIYIQAKKWENSVSRPEIQKFVGALQGKRARKGIFITTSFFTREALEYADNLDVSVILIDGQKLASI